MVGSQMRQGHLLNLKCAEEKILMVSEAET